MVLGTQKWVTPAAIADAEQKLINVLIARAAQKLALGPSSLIVRDILPSTDLFAPSTSGDVWIQNYSSGGIFVNGIYSGQLPNNRLIGFFGFTSRAQATIPGGAATSGFVPTTAAIRFVVGGGRAAVKDYWQVENSYTLYPPVALSYSPVTYDPQDVFNIDMMGWAPTPDRGVLLGHTVEPPGAVIAAPTPLPGAPVT